MQAAGHRERRGDRERRRRPGGSQPVRHRIDHGGDDADDEPASGSAQTACASAPSPGGA